MKFSITIVLGITFVIAVVVFTSSLLAISNHSENAVSHKYDSLVTSPKLIVDKYLTEAVTGALSHFDTMWGHLHNNSTYGYSNNTERASPQEKLARRSIANPWQFQINDVVTSLDSAISNSSSSFLHGLSNIVHQNVPPSNATAKLLHMLTDGDGYRASFSSWLYESGAHRHPASPDVLADAELSDEGGSGADELTCTAAFPPKCRMYPYVRFWNKRFYKEDCYASPLRLRLGPHRKYLLFEPDRGGWNNIRMAAETAIILAHATGRTLVVPPQRDFYLLNRNKNSKDKSTFSKFFDLQKIAESLDMIDMDTFMVEIAGKVISCFVM